MLTGLGWCIGISLRTALWYRLRTYSVLPDGIRGTRPWLTLKLTFYVVVDLGRKLGLIPPARPTNSLGYEESLYWFRVLVFFDGKRSRMPKKANQAKLTRQPIAHFPWAVGTMVQHLTPQALEGE